MIKSFTKRILAIVLCVVMLVSCWVFTAPSATAATAGNYNIKLTFKLNDGCDNLSRYGVASYIRVYYVANNCTDSYSFDATDTGEESSLSYQDYDLFSSAYLAESQKNVEKELPMTLPGFPVKILCYQENKTWMVVSYDGTGYDVTKMTIKNTSGSTTTWDTLWEGQLHVFTGGDWRKASVRINGGLFRQTKAGDYADQATAANASGYENGWASAKPAATSISNVSSGVSSMAVPTDGTTATAATAYTLGTVKDQYGVNWYANPTLSVVDSSGNSITGASISSNKLRLMPTANRSNNYTAYIKETCGSAKNTNKAVSITVFDYIVNFMNGDTLEKTETVDYNSSATPPTVTKAPDETYHYTFSSWTGSYQNLKSGAQTKTVNANFTSTAHTFDQTSVHVDEGDGRTLKTAADCNNAAVYYNTCTCGWISDDDNETHTFGSALGHDYTEQVANEDTLCTAATCTEKATYYYSCSRCHDIENNDEHTFQYGEAEGHSYGEWVTTTSATCTTAGLHQRTCSVCGNIETEDIPATGHAYYEIYTSPTNGTAGSVCFGCNNGCGKYWTATYENDTYTPATEYASLAQAKRNTPASAKVSPPKFNAFYNDDINYNYAMRGASLKIAEPFGFTDRLTRQGLRFTASLHVPDGVDYTGVHDDNYIMDFGYIYSQTNSTYVNNNISNLTLDNVDRDVKKIVKMSVKDNNADKGTFNGSNWTGVTAHADETLGGTTLTYNLVVNVKAYNWSENYCARAYVVYKYHGHEYTVYDNQFSSRSVEYVANAAYEDDASTQKVKNYCNSKILTPISQGLNV